jgi:hypothetical protein
VLQNSPFFLLRSASRLALACIAIFFSLSVDLLLLLLDRRLFDLRISSLLDEEREGILLPSSSSLYFTDLRVDFRSDVDFCCCVAYINNHKYFVVCFLVERILVEVYFG